MEHFNDEREKERIENEIGEKRWFPGLYICSGTFAERIEIDEDCKGKRYENRIRGYLGALIPNL